MAGKAKRIDVHNHVCPATLIEALRANPQRFGMRVEGEGDALRIARTTSKHVFHLVPELYDVEAKLKGLDERGLEGAYLSPGPMYFYYDLPADAGLEAARRRECDVAGVHLLDPTTNQYNRPFLTPELDLIPGYGRLQGVVYRPGDPRFERRSALDAIAAAVKDPACVMVNRNQGSGTRVLIDGMLAGARPNGYAVQASNHSAVAAAVAQGDLR